MRSIPEVTEAAKQVRLETLARLRVKVVQLDRAICAEPSVPLDDVLALIDEEMRDGAV